MLLLVLAPVLLSAPRPAANGPAACVLLPAQRGGPVIGATSLTGVKGSTPAACCAACDAHPACVAFTLSIDSASERECWLKGEAKNGTRCGHAQCISGTNGRKPVPPPPPCASFSKASACPPRRCTWVGGRCAPPPPPPPPPGPCSAASQAECGAGRGPFNGSVVYCAAACRWNGSACLDRKPAGYPMPANDSLQQLAALGSPLRKLENSSGGRPGVRLSFYGDSITWVTRYEPLIQRALEAGPGTSDLNVTLVNQGINGGTAGDLAGRGFSPWGHLDPSKKQSNISFAQTLLEQRPQVVGVQIGINDFLHVDPLASNASAIGAVYAEIVKTVRTTLPSAKMYMATISLDGEEVDSKNHEALMAYAQAMKAVGEAEAVPVVDLLARDLAYERENNCMNRHSGLLTGAGVHPYTPQGAMLLADAHAEGILRALKLDDHAEIAPLQPTTVFADGDGGVACISTPLLAAFPDGELLAFAEARWVAPCLDNSPKSIVMRRSTDGSGAHWGPMQYIVNDSRTNHRLDGLNLGSVTVINASSLCIHYVFCAHTCPQSSSMLLLSTNRGATFENSNITHMTNAGGRQFVPGPGSGIVLSKSSRLVVPGYYHIGTMFSGTEFGSMVLLSDDGGRSFRPGGVIRPRNSSGTGCTYLEPNEAAVVELPDGRVYLEMRNRFQQAACNHRLQSVSASEGETFSTVHESSLPQPNRCNGVTDACGCEGSLVRGPNRQLYFSTPSNPRARTNGTVFSSRDGNNWDVLTVLDQHLPPVHRSFGYSALAPLQQELGLLFSTYTSNSSEASLQFVRVPTKVDDEQSVASFERGSSRRTPPLGWTSWATIGCSLDCEDYPDYCLSERVLMQMMDAVEAGGWKAAGYTLLHVDDCAFTKRDARGELVADPRRFTNGSLATLASYAHSKGLALGAYLDMGNHTCDWGHPPPPKSDGEFPNGPGSYLHEATDIATLARWGLDQVKVDGCYRPANTTRYWEGFSLIAEAIAASGRDMILACEAMMYMEHDGCSDASAADPKCSRNFSAGGPQRLAAYRRLLAPGACNSMTVKISDVQDHFLPSDPPEPDGMDGSVSATIDFFGDNQDVLATQVAAAGPGHYNDPEWLLAGVSGQWMPAYHNEPPDKLPYSTLPFVLTPAQTTAQFVLYSLLSTPLLLGLDFRRINQPEHANLRSLLQNREILAVSQDALSQQGRRLQSRAVQNGTLEVWSKRISGGLAVVLFHHCRTPVCSRKHTVNATLSELGVSWQSASARDLINRVSRPTVGASGISSVLGANGVSMYKLLAPLARPHVKSDDGRGSGAPTTIRAPAFAPLPLRELSTAGWLRRQMDMAAQGLAGNEHLIWPWLRDSQFIGRCGSTKPNAGSIHECEGWQFSTYLLRAISLST